MGSRKRGSVRSAERRRNRKIVFHNAFMPKVKANSVIKVETTRVARRMARAGPISLMFSIMDFFLKNSNMISNQLSTEKGERF